MGIDITIWQAFVFWFAFSAWLWASWYVVYRAAKREKKSFWRSYFGIDRGINSSLTKIEKLIVIVLMYVFLLFVAVFGFGAHFPWSKP